MSRSLHARSYSSCISSHGLRLLALGLCVSTGCAEPQGRDSIEDDRIDDDRNDASSAQTGSTELWVPYVASVPRDNRAARAQLADEGSLAPWLTWSFMASPLANACERTEQRRQLQTSAIVGGISAEFENVSEAHARTLEWVYHPWTNQFGLFHTTTHVTEIMFDEFGLEFAEFVGVLDGIRDLSQYIGATVSSETEISVGFDLFGTSWPTWSNAFTDVDGQTRGCADSDLRAGCIEAHAVAGSSGASVSPIDFPIFWNVTQSSSETVYARWATEQFAKLSSDFHLVQLDGSPCPAEFPDGGSTCVIELGDDDMSIDERIDVFNSVPMLLLPKPTVMGAYYSDAERYLRATENYRELLRNACEQGCNGEIECLESCDSRVEDDYAGACTTMAPADVWVSIQVQNLSNFDDDVELTYFREDGTVAATKTLSVPAEGSQFQITGEVPALARGFVGSVRVRSQGGAKLSALANLLGELREDGGKQHIAGVYEATERPSRVHNLPMIDSSSGAWANEETIIAITNPSDEHRTALIEIEGSDADKTLYLAPHATIHVPMTEWWGTNLFSVGPRGGRVLGDGDLAVAVLHVTPTTMSAYPSAPDGTHTQVPLVNFQPEHGIDTFLYVQNTTDHRRTLTVTYPAMEDESGQPCVETIRDVMPGHTVDFGWSFIRGKGWWDKIVSSRRDSTCTSLGSNETYLGPAHSDHDTAMLMTQSIGEVRGSVLASTAETASETVVFPNVMDHNYGWWTALSVVNVDDHPISVTCRFQDSDRTMSKLNMAPGDVLLDLHEGKLATDSDGDGLVERYIGSATCTATGDILGVANAFNPNATWGDMTTYRGSN